MSLNKKQKETKEIRKETGGREQKDIQNIPKKTKSRGEATIQKPKDRPAGQEKAKKTRHRCNSNRRVRTGEKKQDRIGLINIESENARGGIKYVQA